MNAVSDSSPLIILAKLGCFNLLGRIFSRIFISPEVYREVVVSGAGRPGALEVESADWIETAAFQNNAGFVAAQEKSALGAGELSTILLAKETHTELVLLDDLRASNRQLLANSYVDQHLLDRRLRELGLPPL